MRGRLTKVDLIDACALPALRTAYDALLRRRQTQADIRAALNTQLRALGLQPVTNGAFSRWSKRIALGAAEPPEPGLHSVMAVEGLSQRVDRLEVPSLLATVSLDSNIQVRIVELVGGQISATVRAIAFTGEAMRRGWVDFEPMQFDARKRYAIHFSAQTGGDSYLASVNGSDEDELN